jgi:hypothetical protein
MIYLLVLLPATALTVAGYVALFLSGRSEGGMRTFGRYLGFWAFTLAGLLILGSIFAVARNGHRCPMFSMHQRMHCPVPDSGAPATAPSESPSGAPKPTEAPTAPGAPYG